MSDSFSDWVTKLAEAQCVELGIPCKRRFTDAELERPREEIRKVRGLSRPDHDFPKGES